MPVIEDQARSVFLVALERAPDQWPVFLDEACRANAELRERVERLLHAHRVLGSIHGGGADAPAVTVEELPATERPGTVIGPYKLLEQVGEGGMGTVWMAQQTEPVKRLVAVKLIKAGMDSRQVLARFEAERQALALMDHANIARVLDAGTTGAGRPYFVMDLVKGVSITRYCDDHHLTPRQRLELFIPVCQAVQHAHHKGIIHRDLKPSNVLVALYDGKPVPKVIDFGVAKAAGQTLTDKTLVTGFGSIVGTLEYMSPEQVEINQLDIDTRSDIYSLGVLLYELLTGGPPFSSKELDKGGMLEMLRVIREQEPARPSAKLSTAEGLPTLAANRGTEPAKLTRLVRGELDWIVMKALEKDRSRRYETANGFALDVQRYLADEPVLACPPSAGYRLRKFARRHKVALAVVALVLFFLMLLGGGAGWAVRDRSAREAEAAQQQAARQGKVAGQVETVFAEVDPLEREQKWPEALAAARPAAAAVAGGEADEEITERVRRRLKDLEFIDRLEQIRLEGTLKGLAEKDRGYAQAFRDYGVDVDELAVEMSIQRLKAHPALAIPLAAALDEWSFQRRGGPEVDASVKRLLAIARGIDPEPLRDQLRSTWERPVSGPEVQHDVRRLSDSIDVRAHHPSTLVSLARTLQQVNESDSAVQLLRDAQHVYPGDYWLNSALSRALSEQQDHEGAIRFATAALSIRPHWVAYSELGSILHGGGKLDEAAAAYRKAIELSPKPSYLGLARVLRAQGKFDEAARLYRKQIEIYPTATDYTGLGFALRSAKKLDEANAAFDKAVELARGLVESEPESINHHEHLARILRNQGRLDDATAAYRKAIELHPKSATDSHNLGVCCHYLGFILLDQMKLDEAITVFRKDIELNPKNASAHSDLGVGLATQGKLDDAIAAYRKAIELDPKQANAYSNLGAALADQKKWPDAVAAFRKAIELKPNYVNAYSNLGGALTTQGKLDDAVAVLRKALELDPKHANAYRNLGIALYQRGKLDEAGVTIRKPLEVNPNDASVRHAVARNLNDLAWVLATHAEPARRDPGRAVSLAQEAIELKPQEGGYHNTLGVALYRAGRWGEAVATLEKSMELRKGGDSDDWFFLAMAHWQLVKKDKARQWYERAVQWMDKNQPKNEELRRFRAEAAELLELKEKK
jgi:tetratricopeptide (TPR) repeat protein/serine/threonine protein kinase